MVHATQMLIVQTIMEAFHVLVKLDLVEMASLVQVSLWIQILGAGTHCYLLRNC